jgi:perosamine synthetase
MTFATAHDAIAEQIVGALHHVVGPGPVALHEPTFRGNEWQYLKECLDSTFVSSVGRFVEADLAAYTGAAGAVAVSNGTAALHVALELAGVRPGDEVLMPSLTFIATANAASYCHATPHFVDSEEQTLGVDPDALRRYLADTCRVVGDECVNRHTGRVIRALVPMHTFGHPARIVELAAVAQEFRIALIEDAAESLGSLVDGRHTGTFGVMGVLSFNGNKTVTTGGGGAILCSTVELTRRAKHLTTTAKVPHRWAYSHDEIGYNYRLPNLNAALGCAQLEQLPSLLAAKRQLHARYLQAFESVHGVRVVREPDGCRSNFWLQALRLDETSANGRDRILQATNDAGLMTRPVWTLMHRLPFYAHAPRMPLPVAEVLERTLVNVPSSAHLISDAAP